MADWHIERDQNCQYWLKAEGIGVFPAIIGKAGLIAGTRKREGIWQLQLAGGPFVTSIIGRIYWVRLNVSFQKLYYFPMRLVR